MQSNIETELPTNREVELECETCSHATYHQVLAVVRTRGENGDVSWWNEYLVIQCMGCRTVSFCHESSNSETTDYDPDTGQEELVVHCQLYPRRSAGRAMLEDRYLLPADVLLVYEEARGAFTNKLPIMAGFGLRAIVEAVCKAKGMSGTDLKQQIDSLAIAGHVSSEGAKILHSLRFMGNNAVHEMKAHTDSELSAAFQVAENLLQNVYVIPVLAGQLPQKHAGPADPPPIFE